jgi:hypothetical protein
MGACSGKTTTKAIEDARHPQPHTDAQPEAHMPTGPYRVDTSSKTGDVQVRVEWKDVPATLRASAGRAACGEPAQPALAPTTTWGIPEVFVEIETDHGKAPPEDTARVEVSACGIAPRVAITGPTVAIASTAEEPLRLHLHPTNKLPLGTELPDVAATEIDLPILGHEAIATLEPGRVYQLALVDSPGSEHAAIISATTPYTAVTEANGQVIVRDVPIGTYPVRAWLYPRDNAPSKIANGTVTVTDGALAEVTLDLSAP